MILCITLNPCLDKTLTVPPWRPGDLVRGVAIREVIGGKGNNVARALQRLGRAPVPVTFLGGPTGTACEVMLRQDDGLHPIVIPTAAPTRVIETIRTESTDDQTAFFDPDPAITPSEVDDMIHRVEKALRGNVAALTLSGSSPSPATHGLYSDFIAMANARRIPVFLDTYGPPLDTIWGFWPTAIQLNRREAAAHLRKPTLSDADADALLHKWARHGVACAIITDGPNPVAIQLRGKRYRAIPPRVQAVNPIGSGDSLLAGLVDGWLKRLDPEPLIRHALACAVANALVWDAGAIDLATVEKWSEEIQVETMPPGA